MGGGKEVMALSSREVRMMEPSAVMTEVVVSWEADGWVVVCGAEGWFLVCGARGAVVWEEWGLGGMDGAGGAVDGEGWGETRMEDSEELGVK